MAAHTMKIASTLLSLWYCFMTTTAFTAVTTVPSSSKFGVVGRTTHNHRPSNALHMEKPSDENENITVSRRSAITKGTAATLPPLPLQTGYL
mmetsp:Transcript_4867/g.7471  ORF Transcript_4867/g.7471 Transcript_4867/m.7471 type:complete len:92 (+) Transcript_4867:122-397(+)